MWKYNGTERPSFADEPGPGQESVWDYPRPPESQPGGFYGSWMTSEITGPIKGESGTGGW